MICDQNTRDLSHESMRMVGTTRSYACVDIKTRWRLSPGIKLLHHNNPEGYSNTLGLPFYFDFYRIESGSTYAAWIWLVVRLYVGYAWLTAG